MSQTARRKSGYSPGARPKNYAQKSRKRAGLGRWVGLGLLGLLAVVGWLVYSRFASFQTDTFGARDAASLLAPTATTRALPTATVIRLSAIPPLESNGRPIVSLPLTATRSSSPFSSSSLPDVIYMATATSNAPITVPAAVTVPPTPTPPPTVPATPTAVATATLPPTTQATATPQPTVQATATPQPIAPFIQTTSPLINKIQRGEAFSILVLGYGGAGHDGPYLTDSILQIVYNPAKKTATMINIPRDLYVFVPYGENKKGYWGKANTAFSYVMNLGNASPLATRYNFAPGNLNSKIDAAAILAKDTVEGVTGIPIDYWMAVNFEGFRRLIDSIGGITVNVEKAFDDYQYSTNPGLNDGRNYLHFDAGVQKMNGLRAINYARSRYSNQDSGDLGRSKRQMKVIQAVQQQMLNPDILLKIPGILDALQGNLRTSVSLDETLALMEFSRSAAGQEAARDLAFQSHVLGFDLLNEGSNFAGFVFIPKAGPGNYSAIQEWIRARL